MIMMISKATTAAIPHVLVVLCVCSTLFFPPARCLSTVIFGPGPSEMSLLTAKLASRAGIDTTYVTTPDVVDGSYRMMYGVSSSTRTSSSSQHGPNDDDDDDQRRAKIVTSGTDIGNALSTTNCLSVICCNDRLEETKLTTALNACGSDLSRIVLLSQMGATMGRGRTERGAAGASFMGFLGGGGNNNGPAANEELVRQMCQSHGLELSIVRAGPVLKGGGPGNVERHNVELGLSNIYYNSILELRMAMVTMAHDKFTLGADVVAGDVRPSHGIQQTLNQASFQPKFDESNRIVVAGAMVAAMVHHDPVDMSVASASAERPPTMDEWSTILSSL